MNDHGNVCSKTVAADMCVGCGVCAGVCPSNNLAMEWTSIGCYSPIDHGNCLSRCRMCLDVCPFLDHEQNEDTLAADSFADIDGISHRSETGYYLESYAGYANDGYRERGASGGIASWILASLLERGDVDRVICVRPTGDPERLYAFDVLDNVEAVKGGAKSAYYPVELSQAIGTILREDARYAIIGLPCYLKAISLAASRNPQLRKRITAKVGLVCGHMKSAGLARVIARSLSATGTASSVVFREKAAGHRSSDYACGAVYTDGTSANAQFSSVVPIAWPAGLFKLNACGYCDDIFAEVADVVCMDAWLPAYTSDWRGTSIVVARSEKMRQLLHSGVECGSVVLDTIGIDRVTASQAGVVAQKRRWLGYRLWLTQKSGTYSPQKRVKPRRPNLLQRLSLGVRENVRRTSHIPVHRANGPTSFDEYHSEMMPLLRRMRRISHLQGLARRIRAILMGVRRIGR